MRDLSEQNYYELLEIAAGASADEVHRAYIRAKSTYSEDSPAMLSMFSADEAKQLLNLIDEAYSVLSNDSLRKQYDRRINIQPPMSQSPQAHKEILPASLVFTNRVYATPARSAQVQPPPDGSIATKFGHYKIDDTMESAIQNSETMDGLFLNRIRQYKQISLDQMSQSTRVGRLYLIALEANDYEALPAAVFVRGFVKQVATCLGLDGDKVVKSYMAKFHKTS